MALHGPHRGYSRVSQDRGSPGASNKGHQDTLFCPGWRIFLLPESEQNAAVINMISSFPSRGLSPRSNSTLFINGGLPETGASHPARQAAAAATFAQRQHRTDHLITSSAPRQHAGSWEDHHAEWGGTTRMAATQVGHLRCRLGGSRPSTLRHGAPARADALVAVGRRVGERGKGLVMVCRRCSSGAHDARCIDSPRG